MPNFAAERKKIAEHAAMRKEATALYTDPAFKSMIVLLTEVKSYYLSFLVAILC